MQILFINFINSVLELLFEAISEPTLHSYLVNTDSSVHLSETPGQGQGLFYCLKSSQWEAYTRQKDQIIFSIFNYISNQAHPQTMQYMRRTVK